VTRLIVALVAVAALSEWAPARAQFGFGHSSFGYRGGFSYGGSRVGVSGFGGGFFGRPFVSAPYFGFAPIAPFGPFGPVGFAPFGLFGYANPFWGGWGPVFSYGYGPPVVAVPVPVPVVVSGPPTSGSDSGYLAARNDSPLPQGARPDNFVVIKPRREITSPEVTRVAPVPRPVKPTITFDPFKPPPAVRAEVPEADPKKEAARLVRLARASFVAGDYGRAAEHFERAIAADPADAAVYFWLAQAKFAAGQYAEAVARIRDGLARDPKWPASPFDPTELYGDRPERFVVHLLALKKAVADNPNEATLEFLLGYELWFSSEKAEAEKLFRAAEKRLAAPGPIALFKKWRRAEALRSNGRTREIVRRQEDPGMSGASCGEQQQTPTQRCRFWAYALAWLPPPAVGIEYLPGLVALWARHDERGSAPGLIHEISAFVRFNRGCAYLPTALAYASAVAVAEVLVRRARRGSSGRWAWHVTVAGLGLLTWGALVAMLLELTHPVYPFAVLSD
jgi:tetratricopeptide (TPR) repeat protein